MRKHSSRILTHFCGFGRGYGPSGVWSQVSGLRGYGGKALSPGGQTETCENITFPQRRLWANNLGITIHNRDEMCCSYTLFHEKNKWDII